MLALMNAPLGAPLTPEEQADAEAALAEIHRGDVVSGAAVTAELARRATEG